jgi:hypothetical protein
MPKLQKRKTKQKLFRAMCSEKSKQKQISPFQTKKIVRFKLLVDDNNLPDNQTW